MTSPTNPRTTVAPFISEADWLERRKQDITSTESSALFGMSPYATNFEIWHQKKSGNPGEFKPNERMSWGNRFEAAIAHGIAEEQGWTIEPLKDYWRIPELRIGSSFDYAITNLGEPVHLEIKNVDYFAFKQGWIKHDDGTLEAPEVIEMQVQHQMLVSGFKRSFIGALVGGNQGIVIERQRDEPVITAIRSKIAEFWASIEHNIQPPAIMPEDADAVIALNQYARPGKILDASNTPQITDLVQQWRDASRTEKQAGETAKVLKAQLMELTGDSEKILGNGFHITATMRADSPATVITEDMVGSTYGGRKGYRNFLYYKRDKKGE